MDDINTFSIISRQSNQFIESPFAQEFSEQELKTMEYIITQTKKSDLTLAQNQQVKIMSLSTHNFARMIGAHPDDIYKRANELSEGLMNKKIKCKAIDANGLESFVKHSFFTTMAYSKGTLTIGINPFVLPYFVDIHDNFTEFRLANILRLGSSYGIKLYKLLKQYENTAWRYRDFTIDKLREQLGIDEKKYTLYSNFKSRVVDMAITHINTKTDIKVDYQEFKNKRKVESLRFFIKSKMSQLEQARISFEHFMDKLESKESTQLKHVWELHEKDKEKRFEAFQPCFKRWIELSCHNYIEASTDVLEVTTQDDLFYDKSKVAKEVMKIYFDKPKK